MAGREPLVDEVAGAILDGSTIDWDSVDTASSEADRGLIEELRLLAAVAELHRQNPDLPLGDQASPDIWGHLKLLERIGGGSFGEVYRAHDTRLEREVAVKLMPAARSGGAGIAAIIREGRLLARVRHPGVVTVHDAQQIGDRVGMWMEFVRGQTLEERLAEQGTCTAGEAIEVGIELCRAVAAVHEAGLIHRDIKTQNVMRASDGRLLLMDFGVGRDLADERATHLAGTPLYLAPEILRGQPAAASTDVYAIGVLLFRILTGSFPVRATLIPDLKRAHETGDRQTLLQARPDLPADLAAVIDRALDPQPENRHGSAAELAGALEVVRPRVRSRRWLLAAAAGVVLAAGAGLAVARGWITIGPWARGPLLNPQQWVLFGEFTGTTGDAGLDAAMREAVRAELEASSYLNVFPTAWVRERLRQMARPPDTRIDESLGMEISKSEGLAALVTGIMDGRDGAYELTLRARQVATGRAVSASTEWHRTREEALQAAIGAGRKIRELVGESSVSIRATSAQSLPVTAQSFDTMRHFALGRALLEEERGEDALPHLLEAVKRDPEFAMAHLYAGHAYAIQSKFDLRDAYMAAAAALAERSDVPMSPIEREKIQADYHAIMERFVEAAAHLRAMLSLRPGDGRIQASLGLIHGSLRQYEPAIEAFEAAERSFPHSRVRLMLADMYSASGRPAMATALLSAHLDGPLDVIAYARHLAIEGRRQEAGAALADAERLAGQSAYESWSDLSLAKADFLRSEGRYAAAEVALHAGLARAGRGTERLELAMASLLLDSGRRAEAVASVRHINVGLSRNRGVLGVLAARAGALDTAAVVLAQLEEEAAERHAPRADARVHQLRAEIALARGGNPAVANDQAARAAKTFPTTWTLVTLARAQEALGRHDVAIATWTSILERPGERAFDWDAPAYAQVVLARYQLGRLLEETGQSDRARDAYDEVLRLWAQADAKLPAYVDVRARRARLAPPPGRF